MNNEATTEIYDYLKKMAADIVEKDMAELNAMKNELAEYAEGVSSQMPQESKEMMKREFEKCSRCAQEWMRVYKDTHFNEAVKEDILKEDVMEFFFSMNEKVVAVQKNFFLLAMVQEHLSPKPLLTDELRSAKIAKSRIMTLAKQQGLNPSYKDHTSSIPGETSSQRLWFFGDENNLLQSSQEGLPDDQALDYLLD
ncbi:hypothetical protein [Desulforhopalus sp. 52FAK]